jgi:hypothetical protein
MRSGDFIASACANPLKINRFICDLQKILTIFRVKLFARNTNIYFYGLGVCLMSHADGKRGLTTTRCHQAAHCRGLSWYCIRGGRAARNSGAEAAEHILMQLALIGADIECREVRG